MNDRTLTDSVFDTNDSLYKTENQSQLYDMRNMLVEALKCWTIGYFQK